MTTTTVFISKINETFLYVDASPSILAELEEHFKFRPDGYQFHPAYKNRMWDGYLRIFSNQKLYCGLINYLITYCESCRYIVQLNGDISIHDTRIVTKNDVVSMIQNDFSTPPEIELRDYQLNAIKDAINFRRGVLLSSTGSGKSWIQYILTRFYQEYIESPKKLLIIVPTTSLVYQMYNDFKAYSSCDDSWNVEDHVHIIMAGKDKDCPDKEIYISTWQSLQTLPKKYFHQFHFINIDECHLAQANTIKKIVEASINCKYRFGTTGTLKDSKTHHLTIEGLLGPVIKVASTKELIKQDVLSDIEINFIQLDHQENVCKAMQKSDYRTETDFLEISEKRCRFLANMGDYFAKNTLFLFNRREHGKSLYNALKSAKKPDEIYYVDGTVSAEQREAIREACEDTSKCVYIVASFQVFSTGINIKNLHNIVFTTSTKSPIRVLQSIGRGVRKHKDKSKCVVYDVYDNLKYKSWVNYSLKHAKERELIYMKQGFKYTKTKVKL